MAPASPCAALHSSSHVSSPPQKLQLWSSSTWGRRTHSSQLSSNCQVIAICLARKTGSEDASRLQLHHCGLCVTVACIVRFCILRLFCSMTYHPPLYLHLVLCLFRATVFHSPLLFHLDNMTFNLTPTLSGTIFLCVHVFAAQLSHPRSTACSAHPACWAYPCTLAARKTTSALGRWAKLMPR